MGLTFAGLIYAGTMIALGKNSNYAGFITNCFWGTVNIFAMSGIVLAALWKPTEEAA
jgi:cellulose synthase (UDP-forming)